MYFVLVHQDDSPPWVLNLDGHRTVAAADRAMSWQRQFNPDTLFTLARVEDDQLVVHGTGQPIEPSQGPYTDSVWAAFKEKYR